jgi:hypothetical protein
VGKKSQISFLLVPLRKYLDGKKREEVFAKLGLKDSSREVSKIWERNARNAISFSSSQGNEKDGETLGIKKRHRLFFPFGLLFPPGLRCWWRRGKEAKRSFAKRDSPRHLHFFFHGLQACGRILNDSILRFFWGIFLEFFLGVGAGEVLKEGLVVGV